MEVEVGEGMDVAGDQELRVLRRFCELVVPGAESCVDRLVAGAARSDEDALHSAIGLVATCLDSVATLDRISDTDAFRLLRGLAVEARYGTDPRRDHADVVVVGDGIGGRLLAADLGARGRDVLVLGTDPPPRATVPAGDDDEPVALTPGGPAVAARDPDCALSPWYERVEQRLAGWVRPDWPPSVHAVLPGFTAAGVRLDPVRTYLPPPAARATRLATRLRFDGTVRTPVVTGVECHDGAVSAPAVVLAADAVTTARILVRDGVPGAGHTLGLHPTRRVFGLFDEPWECAPAAHCLAHRSEFVVGATTRPGPVRFAAGLVDGGGNPLWGSGLAAAAAEHARWIGLSVCAADDNDGTVELDPAGHPVVTKGFSAAERARLDAGLRFATDVLHAAGARRIAWSGLFSAHPWGSAPGGSVVDDLGRVAGVEGLYVADPSVLRAPQPAGPSLTVLAMAARLAEELA